MTALLVFLVAHIAGQTTAPVESAPTTRPSVDSPEAQAEFARIRTLLGGVRDNVFSFDDPAFYHLCAFVAAYDDPQLTSPVADGEPLEWRFLHERPSDYRGKLVAIEGLLQRCSAFHVTDRPGVGTLYQSELSQPNSQAISTVITTEDMRVVPRRSRVRVRGYFLKAREFQTTGKETGAGPLLIARRLQVVPGPAASGGQILDWSNHRNLILGATLVLAIVWVYLRRKARRVVARTSHHRPTRADTPPSDRDFDWLTDRTKNSGGSE